MVLDVFAPQYPFRSARHGREPVAGVIVVRVELLDSSDQLHPSAAPHPPGEHIPTDGFRARSGAEFARDVFPAELDVAVGIRALGAQVALILFRTTGSAELKAAL